MVVTRNQLLLFVPHCQRLCLPVALRPVCGPGDESVRRLALISTCSRIVSMAPPRASDDLAEPIQPPTEQHRLLRQQNSVPPPRSPPQTNQTTSQRDIPALGEPLVRKRIRAAGTSLAFIFSASPAGRLLLEDINRIAGRRPRAYYPVNASRIHSVSARKSLIRAIHVSRSLGDGWCEVVRSGVALQGRPLKPRG